MQQPNLFPETLRPATDEEVMEVLGRAMSQGGGLSRLAELYLNAACAKCLMDALHLAGLRVVRPMRE
jgi:hypothetical protein